MVGRRIEKDFNPVVMKPTTVKCLQKSCSAESIA